MVRLKRKFEAPRKLHGKEARRARIRPVPNEADLVLGPPAYDEEYDDAFHERKLTALARLDRTVWQYQAWASGRARAVRFRSWNASGYASS